MLDKIYCYGGRNWKNENFLTNTLNDFYYLDVSKDFAVQDALSMRNPIKPNGLELPPNLGSGLVSLTDAQVIAIHGGIGYGNGTELPQQTLVYDPRTNNLRSIDSDGIPQM